MCNRRLADDEYTGAGVSIGQLAHIVGWSTASGSPRGKDELPGDERNDEDNLMLLCYDQHRVIDNRSLWDVYDVKTLRTMKRRHEHRVRQLTDLVEDDKTTVLRIIGSIRGASVSAPPQTVANALLANGRFPDYALLGVDELEVDLRQLAGENPATNSYWEVGRDTIAQQLRLLRAKVDRENVRHISVFAFARIPLLVALGAELDDSIPTEIYPKRRNGDEGWGWLSDAATSEFEFRTVRTGADPARVAIMFSISGTVNPALLPGTVDSDYYLYELGPAVGNPNPDIIANAATLDNFAQTWRALLAYLEAQHPGLDTVDIFPAVPIPAAITIGQAPMRHVHPTLRVYDRTADMGYELALEVNR
ncbi:SAVED domain-containing protein [Mycolicibacterium nivoides]|uniref:SAVED domain-containing protein n=1 Tax=Mycolicibacterium nivoides TaxID=2487344 RepID=A0ABW9LIH5_9MYCO